MEKDLIMTNVQLQIKIDERRIQQDLLKDVQKTIYKSIPKIQSALSDKLEGVIFRRLISGVPTIQGRDLYEIGVPDINSRISSIIRLAAKSFEIKIIKGKLLRIQIGILREGYSDLLSLPESVFTYTSSRGSGVLQWLKWLLLDGNTTIIGGFDFIPSSSSASRTSGGIMRSGGSWKVPPSLSGNEANNILTRSLENINKDLEVVIKQELQRIIK